MCDVIKRLYEALERAEVGTKTDAQKAVSAIRQRHSDAPSEHFIRGACEAILNVPGAGDRAERVSAARRMIGSAKMALARDQN